MGIDPNRIIKRVLFNGNDIQLIGEGCELNKLPQVINKTVVELTAEDLAGLTNIPASWQENNKNLKKVELPEGIKQLTANNTFKGCSSLEDLILPYGLTSISGSNSFSGLSKLKRFVVPETVNTISGQGFLQNSPALEEVTGLKTTAPRTLYSGSGLGFESPLLETVSNLDIRNIPNNGSLDMLTNYQARNSLTNFYLYSFNLSCSLTGSKLTVESLIHTAQQLIDKTGTTSCTLTLGTTNKAKIANIYVKLIDTITEEMIADDDLIESKLPCEVCESTDESAMLLEDYIYLKNWKLA